MKCIVKCLLEILNAKKVNHFYNDSSSTYQNYKSKLKEQYITH